MTTHIFSFPTTIVFGPGAIQQLPAELEKRGMRSPLIVTDAGLAGTPIVGRIRSLIPGAPLFSNVDPNPTEKNVLEGVAFYKDRACDSLVGIGGGSPIDAAKAIRLKITHNLDLAGYDDKIDGGAKITSSLPPYIAIPTTAGTGSEVGRSAVITLHQTNRKTVIFSPWLIPSLAIVDPELTLGLPRQITAGTGMDAFTHNVEAYLSKGFHPICDAIALGGARLASENLPLVMTNPNDLDARGNMLMASMMGAIAFQKGLGATHSLAHPLSSDFGMHHGTSNAVLLPVVLEYNRESVPGRFTRLEEELGCDPIVRVRELNKICEIATRLRDYGIPEDRLPSLAAKAEEDACHLLNPRPCNREDLLGLYRAAW